MSEIVFVRQECWPDCTDPECPYVHSRTGWYCDGNGPFETRDEAIAADNLAEDQATIRCGDDLTNTLLSRNES